MIRVAILGGCATRDAIDIADPKHFQLVDYTARTSLASLVTPAFVLREILDSISSPFQRRMVERDMRKTYWQRLPELQFDYLVLDFISDRFAMNLFKTGAAHLCSAEYQRAFSAATRPKPRRLSAADPARMRLWE